MSRNKIKERNWS